MPTVPARLLRKIEGGVQYTGDVAMNGNAAVDGTLTVNNLSVTGEVQGVSAEAEIGAGDVGTTELAADAVTGAKIDPSSFLHPFAFEGRNGAGAVTLTGAAVGDVVAFLARVDGVGPIALGSGDFEATITVNDEIQQTAATDQSEVQYFGFLLKRG